MASALDGGDGVGEGEDGFDECVVVLQRDLDLCALDLTVDVEGSRVDHRLVAIECAHEGDDAALEVEGVGEAKALIRERDLQPLVEISHLTQPVLDDLAIELGVGEDLRVGPEPNDCPGVVDLAHDLDGALGHATGELHVVDLAAAMDPDLEVLAEEVDRGHAHLVEA